MNPALIAGLFLVLALPAWATNRFIEAGFPAADREWTGADLTSVGTLLKDPKTPLPTLADPEGAPVFERITSLGNLAVIKNQNLPLSLRLGDFIACMNGFRDILSAYATAANERGAAVHTELAQLMVFALHANVAGSHVVEEFMATVPHDEKYAVRIEGLKTMRSGCATMINGVEASLGESTFYSASDLSLMLAGLRDTLPTLLGSMTEDHRLELRRRLAGRLAQFTSRSDETALKELIRTIETYKSVGQSDS